MSAIGFRSCGCATPSSRVHGKFSSQDAWLASLSIDWTTVPGAQAVPPVVPDDLRVRMSGAPRGRAASAAGIVAAVAVHEQEAAKALPVQRVEQLADDGLVGLDAQGRAAGYAAKYGVSP